MPRRREDFGERTSASVHGVEVILSRDQFDERTEGPIGQVRGIRDSRR